MLHPPKAENSFQGIIFRNDDVSYDTNVARFVELTEVFHRAGFVQLNGITIYGLCNYTVVQDGQPWIYDSINRDEYHVYEKCVEASKDYYIGNNKSLIRYINSIPDPIALHGLYHSDYSFMTYEQQETDIREGLNLLKELFPKKKVNTFIPPFNKVSDDTYKICRKYGLRVSALEGEHFEDRIANDKGPLYEGELYRYHHHRFYPESTFRTYDLSIEILKKYLEKYAYTFNQGSRRYKASLSLKKCVEDRVSIDHCGDKEKSFSVIERLILKYNRQSDGIMQFCSYDGNLLENLWFDGFSKLCGVESEQNCREYAQSLVNMMGHDIAYVESIDDFKMMSDIGALVCVLDNDIDIGYLFNKGAKLLGKIGYIYIVATERIKKDLIDEASRIHAMLIVEEVVESDRDVKAFVFRRIKPRVCFYCDTRNWAHDHSAQELKKYLSDEFEIDIKYVVDRELVDVDDYDAFLVFWWGENSYQWKWYSKSRIIKQVSSHRWQFDKTYGPMNVKEFAKAYLKDSDTVICPSKILYDLLKEECRNLFLCGKGYSSEKFYFKRKRTDGMSLCMAGNINDPVKGVQDILVPSCDGYKLDYANNIRHDDLSDFYNDHDIYVVSSVHEADPLPLIESMACGCFPISTRIGIAPELIRHKENGYLVEKRTVEGFREAISWCENHLDEIRNKANNIAEEIFETRRWEIRSETYRMMLRDHISRR